MALQRSLDALEYYHDDDGDGDGDEGPTSIMIDHTNGTHNILSISIETGMFKATVYDRFFGILEEVEAPVSIGTPKRAAFGRAIVAALLRHYAAADLAPEVWLFQPEGSGDAQWSWRFGKETPAPLPSPTPRSPPSLPSRPVSRIAQRNACFSQHNASMPCSGLELRELLARGGYGAVHSLCTRTDDRCKYVVKFQRYDDAEARVSAVREAVLSKRLYDRYGVGPAFIGAWDCPAQRMFAMVLDRWDGSLRECEKLTTPLVSHLKRQVGTLHNKFSLIHTDLLAKNVLVRRNARGVVTEATIADFGLVWPADRGWTIAKARQWLQYYAQFKCAWETMRLLAYSKDLEPDSAAFEAVVAKSPAMFDMALVGWLRRHQIESK